MARVRVLRVRVRVLCIRVRVLTEELESVSESLKIWTPARLEYTVDSSPTSLLDCTRWAGYGNHLSIGHQPCVINVTAKRLRVYYRFLARRGGGYAKLFR